MAGTKTAPDTRDAGAAAFLHGPEGLFAADIPIQTADKHGDDQGHDGTTEAVR